MKNYILLSLLLSAGCGVYAAAPTEANLFWTGHNQGDISSRSYWSTSATEVVNPTSIDWANTVIGHMDTFSDANNSGFMAQSSQLSALTIKGIYWGAFSDAASGNFFHIYQGGSNGSLTVTDGITLDMSADAPSGYKEVRIRRRNGSGTYDVSVGDLYIADGGGVITLGTGSTGEFLTSLNLNGNITANNGGFYITTNNISMSMGNTVTLNDSFMTFFLGKADSNAPIITPQWASVNMTENDFYIGGKSSITYGKDWQNRAQGDFTMGNLYITSPDAQLDLNLYSDQEYVRSIKSISMQDEVSGEAGSYIYIKTNNYAIDVGSIENGVQTFQYAASINVYGDFVDAFSASGKKSFITPSSVIAILRVMGTFSSQNTNGTVFSRGQGSNNYNYYFGGIVDGAGRLTTSGAAADGYIDTDTGLTIIHLTGSDTYSTSSKISDSTWISSFSENVSTEGAFSIRKEGTGTQYMRGSTWYRGDTIVQDGRLYIRADNSGRAPEASIWGLGWVILKGGYFGSCGADSEIGTTYIRSLRLEGGTLAVDFEGTSCDLISILGTQSVIDAASSDLLKFEFNLGEGVLTDNEYKIIAWDSSVGNLEYDLSQAQYIINGRDDVSAILSYAQDGGINVSFVIPEPSTYAAIFGALALGFALLRRRK